MELFLSLLEVLPVVAALEELSEEDLGESNVRDQKFYKRSV